VTIVAAAPRCALDAARAADLRARDRMAAAIDEHLARAPLMRAIAARLLTRAISRSDASTVVAIAADVRMRRTTLDVRIQRAGGASIRRLRREMIVVRVAAIVETSRLPWPVIAELLGTPRAHTLLHLVVGITNLPPSLWRERIRVDAQLEYFRRFLTANAAAWSQLAQPGARLFGALSPTDRR
jgi:hypothetical protein